MSDGPVVVKLKGLGKGKVIRLDGVAVKSPVSVPKGSHTISFG